MATPDISVSSRTDTIVTIAASGLTVGLTYYLGITSDGADYAPVPEDAFTPTTSTHTKTFSGLAPGTIYSLHFWQGNSQIGFISVITNIIPNVTVSDTSVVVNLPNLIIGDQYAVQVKLGSSVVNSASFTSTTATRSVTLMGLTAATTYSLVALHQSGQDIYTGQFTTQAVPSMEVVGITDTSITVDLTDLIVGVEYYLSISPPGTDDTFTAMSDTYTRTFGGLTPDTAYEITFGASENTDIVVDVYTLPIPSFTVVSVTNISVTVALTNLITGFEYETRVTLGTIQKASTTFTATATTKTVTLTGLSAETTYNFYLYQNGAKIGTIAFKTLAATSLEVTDITETSITATMSGLIVNAEYIISLESSDGLISEEFFVATSSSKVQIFADLMSGTQYIITFQNSDTLEVIATATATTLYVRPPDWEWTSTITDKVQRDGTIGLTAEEWTAFCARINEFCAYTGMAQRNFTAVSQGTPINSAIINGVRTVISAIPGHGALPGVMTVGAVFTPTLLFAQLKNALNAVP